jgi:hypothetical protein
LGLGLYEKHMNDDMALKHRYGRAKYGAMHTQHMHTLHHYIYYTMSMLDGNTNMLSVANLYCHGGVPTMISLEGAVGTLELPAQPKLYPPLQALGPCLQRPVVLPEDDVL